MDLRTQKLFMVFDVESIGLHGEDFAVGYVVIDLEGKKIDESLMFCEAKNCNGTVQNHEWVQKNIFSVSNGMYWPNRISLHQEFWKEWLYWKKQEAILVGDCCWPVEANFLSACIKNCSIDQFEGPYPLLDIASIQFAVGENPLLARDRLPDELPIHNPLADARQSARLLVDLIKKIEGKDNGKVA